MPGKSISKLAHCLKNKVMKVGFTQLTWLLCMDFSLVFVLLLMECRYGWRTEWQSARLTEPTICIICFLYRAIFYLYKECLNLCDLLRLVCFSSLWVNGFRNFLLKEISRSKEIWLIKSNTKCWFSLRIFRCITFALISKRIAQCSGKDQFERVFAWLN